MIIAYIISLCFILLAVAFAAIVTDRHFIAIMLAIELIFLASTIALVSFFVYLKNPSPSGPMALLSIWSVASVEIIAVISFYLYIRTRGFSFDIEKLSSMKW
ncbi:MAG: hypothetical protein M1122_01725 [Candidatus Marsarchaeota archaeon]|jgi:NADH:ubiquinone oxidoreductase subunit K|nr:hypothetical protein [Candidatus Marsarchaeota archaeon]